jgi:peptide/nickel transport system substrate-binding protein
MMVVHDAVGRLSAGAAIARRYGPLVLAGALVCLVSFVGSAGAGSTKATAKPILRLGTTYSYDQFWPSPDKYVVSGREGSTQVSIQYAPLLHALPGGKLVPALATKWRTFSTGRGANRDFEFTLVENAKFGDGTPVNAANVVTWLSWFAANNSSYGPLIGPKPKFVATGKYTVQVHLTIPVPTFFTLFSDIGFGFTWVASPNCVADPALFLKGQCGAGPFMLDPSQSVKGDHYTFVPNPGYYNPKAVKWGGVYQKVIGSASTLLQALQAGQLDIVCVGNDASTAQAAVSGGAKVYSANTTEFGFLIRSVTGQGLPTDNLKVRQAVNYALDRKAIATALGFGYGKPLYTFKLTDVSDPRDGSKIYPYNPAKAKQLLTAGGFPNGFSTKIYTSSPQQAQFVQVAAKYLDDIGIHLDPTPASLGQIVTLNKTVPFSGVQLSAQPTSILFNQYLSPSSSLAELDSDPIINKAYYAGLNAKDPTKDWQKLWQRVTDQAVMTVPIASLPLLWYATPKVGGISVSFKRGGTVFITELYPK